MTTEEATSMIKSKTMWALSGHDLFYHIGVKKATSF